MMKRLAHMLVNLRGIWLRNGVVTIVSDDLPAPGVYDICLEVEKSNLAHLAFPVNVNTHAPTMSNAPSDDSWVSVYEDWPPDDESWVVCWCSEFEWPRTMRANILLTHLTQVKNVRGMRDKIRADQHFNIIAGGYFATHWKPVYKP